MVLYGDAGGRDGSASLLGYDAVWLLVLVVKDTGWYASFHYCLLEL